jgi:hypothetical protein
MHIVCTGFFQCEAGCADNRLNCQITASPSHETAPDAIDSGLCGFGCIAAMMTETGTLFKHTDSCHG